MPVASERCRVHTTSRAEEFLYRYPFCLVDQVPSHRKQVHIAMSEQRRRRLPAPAPPSLSARKRTREESTPQQQQQQQQPSTWTPIGDDGTESSSALTSNKRRKSNMGLGIDLAVTTASTILHTAAEAVVFCTVLGLAAYRLWYGEDRNASPRLSSPPIAPRTAEELRAAPGRLEAEGGPVQGYVLQDSPPSYEALFLTSDSKLGSAATSPLTRRTPHSARSPAVRKRRPIKVASALPRRSLGDGSPALASSASFDTHSPSLSSVASPTILSHRSSPSLAPSSPPSTIYSPVLAVPYEEDELDDDPDETFSSMSARLQEMIKQGNDALSSAGDIQGSTREEVQEGSDLDPPASRKFAGMREHTRALSAAHPSRLPRASGHRSRPSLG